MRPRGDRNPLWREMEGGSTSKQPEKPQRHKGRAHRPGPWPPKIDPFVPRSDHNPRELKSWARRTGFVPNVSGETATTLSEVDPSEGSELLSPLSVEVDLESEVGKSRNYSYSRKKGEIEQVLGRRRRGESDNGGIEIPDGGNVGRRGESDNRGIGIPNGGNTGRRGESDNRGIGIPNGGNVGRRGESDNRGIEIPNGGNAGRRGDAVDDQEDFVSGLKRLEKKGCGPELVANNDVSTRNGAGSALPKVNPMVSPEQDTNRVEHPKDRKEVEIDMISGSSEPEYPLPSRPSGLNCDLTEIPRFPKLVYYGLQHYLSLAGSLVFIPLITVPIMGGTDKETATVISTMLLISGVTTILHSYFGTRLPLVQGSSFVFLAPILVIANSEEFRNLSENKFKNIMRELQGAIIVGSLFQTILGYSGLMSLMLRLINPLVVAPTVAAVGLAYFSYGFPQAGSCAAISIPLILLTLIFTLYLRKISLFGHRLFLIYAVPLSVAIMWACAFFLTAGGAYNYKECNPNIPSSNILLDACRTHVLTMKHCRTDVSNAWRTAAWVRVPYPFQWGLPIIHFRTSFMMVIVSLVASVDSVGSYHATSLLVNIKPPTPGIVSRSIGLEGCTSILAGLWGTGTGSTTLTENVHTIYVTKMAGRRAVEVGAAFLILFSFVGKIGAILASIPLSLAASVLCFTWALIVALGLSTLQYTQSASSRNMIIVGFSLFISLSVPAYIQQYQPLSRLILPGYLVPYSAASSGPIHTGSSSLDYALNALLSLNMVVALLVAFILDNTAPGDRQERGAYIWSKASHSDGIERDPSLSSYYLPEKIGRFFCWARCVGS